MFYQDPRLGGMWSSRNIVLGAVVLLPLAALLTRATPAQAGLAAMIVGAAMWLRLSTRRQLDGVELERTHRPRVFEGDTLEVMLSVRRGEGLPIQLLEIEDQFMASLSISRRHLVPLLAGGYEVLVHDNQRADRHRGLYIIGPIGLRAADPLGVFFETRELATLTRLTVYPRAEPLPHYQVPGPWAPLGPSMDRVERVGQAEEVLGVREYRPGDPPSRVHWRSTARRAELHVMELNRSIQAELTVMLDMTRRMRLGVGGESTVEVAVAAATAVLTRGHEARHRLSLAYAREAFVRLPVGSGMDHLHLLLDRLAVITPDGETPFWEACAAHGLSRPRGSRVVFVVVDALVISEQAHPLIQRLVARGVAVDVILINNRKFMRIYSDQSAPLDPAGGGFEALAASLTAAGARVYPLTRDQPRLSSVVLAS